MFANETVAALKIIDRGDLDPDEMIGSWAGELGQTQFLPTHYFTYAVDYDGDGRRNLLSSPEDVIGSTANYIANGLKWRRGEPWLQEVRVPQELPSSFPWDQADLTIQLPRSKWAQLGVTFPDGKRCRTTICRRRCCCRWADGAGVPRLSEFRRYTSGITR